MEEPTPILSAEKALEQRVRDLLFEESKRAFMESKWFVSKDGTSLCSSDFSTDVVLSISGDFADEAHRLAYAYWLLQVINKGEAIVLAEAGNPVPAR